MIRPLRSVHRLVFFAWILLLPAVFIGGLLSRHQWPPDVANDRKEFRQGKLLTSEMRETAGNLRFEARVLTLPTDPNARAVEIISETSLVSPDVLVYWSAPRPDSNLPASAQLLGSYHPQQPYRLPNEAKGAGFVVLYSLAQQKILGYFSLEHQS